MAARIDGFIPELWSAELLRTKEKALVYGALANTKYEGEIKDVGNRVKISQVGDVAVNTYTKNSTSNLTIQPLADAAMYLDIDQAKYFAFDVDDIDKAQINIPFMQEAMRKAAYRLNDVQDQFLASLYGQCVIAVNSSSSPVDMTSTNVIQQFLTAGQNMTEQNAGYQGRFIVIPPWMLTKLTLAGIRDLTDNTNVYANGFVGRSPLLGFDVYVSNNVNKDSTAFADCKCIFGIKGETFTFAEQITKVETYRKTAEGFGDTVKGLDVYGGRILQADISGTLFADYTAES